MSMPIYLNFVDFDIFFKKSKYLPVPHPTSKILKSFFKFLLISFQLIDCQKILQINLIGD